MNSASESRQSVTASPALPSQLPQRFRVAASAPEMSAKPDRQQIPPHGTVGNVEFSGDHGGTADFFVIVHLKFQTLASISQSGSEFFLHRFRPEPFVVLCRRAGDCAGCVGNGDRLFSPHELFHE